MERDKETGIIFQRCNFKYSVSTILYSVFIFRNAINASKKHVKTQQAIPLWLGYSNELLQLNVLERLDTSTAGLLVLHARKTLL